MRPSARGYRPDVSLPGAEAKLLKPQNVVEMLALVVVGPGDCLALPILHDLPPPRTASDDQLVAFRATCFRLTAPSSLTGAPQVVVPVDHARSGNTYGLGLIGAPGADRALLDLVVRACDGGALGV